MKNVKNNNLGELLASFIPHNGEVSNSNPSWIKKTFYDIVDRYSYGSVTLEIEFESGIYLTKRVFGKLPVKRKLSSMPHPNDVISALEIIGVERDSVPKPLGGVRTLTITSCEKERAKVALSFIEE